MTGTRADYPRVRDVLLELDRCSEIDLVVGCTAQHLTVNAGYTFSDVFSDFGNQCRPFQMYSGFGGDPFEMGKSACFASFGFANLIAEEKPDAILLTVDRAETIAASVASIFANVPIFHIQGGELTGTVDEVLRHAISKLSHVHFVANEAAKGVLCQLGENPENIHVTGCPYVDYISSFEEISKGDLAAELGLDVSKEWIPVIYHPVTTEYADASKHVSQLMEVMKSLECRGYEVIYFSPNMDAGRMPIEEAIRETGAVPISNLSPDLFLSLLKASRVMVGNTSAAIRECPYIPLACVNLGSRQAQRLRTCNVIDASLEYDSIMDAFEKALCLDLSKVQPVYGSAGAVQKIVDITREYLSLKRPFMLQKQFHAL